MRGGRPANLGSRRHACRSSVRVREAQRWGRSTNRRRRRWRGCSERKRSILPATLIVLGVRQGGLYSWRQTSWRRRRVRGGTRGVGAGRERGRGGSGGAGRGCGRAGVGNR
ncbi:hypothetical protein DFH09DRAFT_1362122 [Mycena vulgaris]|nr:hypothetical protein DFH09DRAFT_1362122 [Mycena vulgaris]